MTERIPLLRMGQVVVVPVQVHLHDSLVRALQQELLEELSRRPTRHLVIDVSAVQVLDTYTARALAQTGEMSRLLGVEMVLTGLSPAVAVTLIDMGFDGAELRTAPTLELALTRLARRPRR